MLEIKTIKNASTYTLELIFIYSHIYFNIALIFIKFQFLLK